MNTVTTTSDAEQIQTEWRTLAIAGGLIAIAGLLALVAPFATGIALTYVLGALLVVGGIIHAGHAFTVGDWTGRFWQLALAVVSVIAGIILLVNPMVGLVSLTLLVIAYLVVDGAAELWMSIRMSGESGRGWIAASGVVSLVLAAFLWAGFPVDATWLIGAVVGVALLMTGFSMIAVAYSGRRIDEDDVTPPAAEPRRA
ncbi:HdeD family acid-resistance protein [Natronolimnobius sp. AArcel1]|uniref:HdeD family acid-resistance protein n=1 Tax=Natronolimnobius sp. AArcel1 TaxID=1679093 RepID=UPI0013EB9F67|nr:HdeD family acid-resistance protein [Natronolimnobius sp. AArcel1]NGM67602.1 HdeD family acid-resistance protein [Natronolimnobius sp. AArcel1]